LARLLWEVDALEDLVSISEYIERQSPDYAPVYVRRVIEAVERLVSFPSSGRVVPELGDSSLREVIFQNYRIVYESGEDEVIILGVIHAALDFPGVAQSRGWQLS
jgi:plasmid stabilization system protein ParE